MSRHKRAPCAPDARRRVVVFVGQADADARAGRGGAAVPPARCTAPLLAVSLRVDDSDSGVVLELRLSADAPGGAALEAALEGLSLRGHGKAACEPCADAVPAAEVVSARLARLGAVPLSRGTQHASYLGFCAPLLAHMRSRGLRTLSTAAARRWLAGADAGGLVERLVAAHGVATFADLQARCIAPLDRGRQRSGCLRSMMRHARWTTSCRTSGAGQTTPSISSSCRARSTAASTATVLAPLHHVLTAGSSRTDLRRALMPPCAVTAEKVERYMGRAVASVVKAFCEYVRRAAADAVDFSAFEGQLVMHM